MIRHCSTAAAYLILWMFHLGFFTSPLSAQQNSSGTLWKDTPTWQPYLEGNFRGGGLIERGELDLFLPLIWNNNSLLFADLRSSIGDIGNAEGNWALAARHLTENEWILGIWSSYDLRRSPTGNNFDQISFGLEAMDLNWDLRLTGYIPTSLGAKPTSVQALLSGGNIIVRRNQERAYRGLDGEIGRLLWFHDPVGSRRRNDWLASLDAELRGFVGGFYFDNPAAGFKEITGPRVRAELRLYDLAVLGDGSRLTFEALTQHDSVRGTQFEGAVFVRIPFGRRGSKQLSPIKRRMPDRIVRDVDVVANQAASSVEAARIAQTGQLASAVFVVDGNTANPETVIEGAGANSVVIADGSNGMIILPGKIDMPTGQMILGGGSQLQVIGDQTGTPAVFTAPGIRGTFSATGFNAVSTADNTKVAGLDIITNGNAAVAIDINNDTNVLIQNVSITTNGTNAFGITSAGTSQFTLNNSMITTNGGFAEGIRSSDSSQFTVNNSTITTGGTNSYGIHSYNNSQFTVNNSAITTGGAGATGIDSASNSRFTINGGSITTTGPFARGVDVKTYSYTETAAFQLSGVTINSTNNSVSLDSNFFLGGTIHATVTGSTITADTGFDEIYVSVQDSAVICLNASGNTLDGGAGSIKLDSLFSSATVDVTQDAPGSGMNGIDALNGISPSNIFTSGTINFGAAACPLP